MKKNHALFPQHLAVSQVINIMPFIMADISQFLMELKKRSLLKDLTSYDSMDISYIYCGFDPTAKSLHIGHLIPLTIMKIAKKYNISTIVIIGSGTAEIGDPTDKNEMRKVMSKEEIEVNAKMLKEEFKRIGNPDFIIDNKDWLSEITMLEFMRIGMDFSVNNIIKMHTFATRLETCTHLSITEILYPLLQAYDWALLNGMQAKCSGETKKMLTSMNGKKVIQLGGSDQFGNIVQGTQYISKVLGFKPCGITSNLLTMKSGAKMGKSIKGALYLNKSLISPYDFYQSLINFEDESARSSMIQLIIDESVDSINAKFDNDPRVGKEDFAYKLTKLVHGEIEANLARKKSDSIFKANEIDLMNTWHWNIAEDEIKLKKFIHCIGLAKSISEAEKIIANRGIMLNAEIQVDPNYLVQKGSHTVSFGKKKHIRIIPE